MLKNIRKRYTTLWLRTQFHWISPGEGVKLYKHTVQSINKCLNFNTKLLVLLYVFEGKAKGTQSSFVALLAYYDIMAGKQKFLYTVVY